MNPSKNLFTIGEIARDLGVSWWKLNYALRINPEIQPVQRVGCYRCYDAKSVEQVRVALEEIRKAKEPTPA